MKKLKWLRILNIFVVLGFLTAAISIILDIYFHVQLFNDGEMLVKIHMLAGKILIILIVLHLILNWNWIQTQYLKKKKQAPLPKSKPSSKKTK